MGNGRATVIDTVINEKIHRKKKKEKSRDVRQLFFRIRTGHDRATVSYSSVSYGEEKNKYVR